MTPLISSMAAGSVRGFGRGRILTRLIPFTSISNVTSDNDGTVTISWTTNQTTGYRIQLYINGVLNVQGPSTLTGSTNVYVGTCTTRTYQMKLQNIATGLIEAESNTVTYESNAFAYGVELSFTCNGCTKTATRSAGVCGVTYTDSLANSFSCCSPIDFGGVSLTTTTIEYYVSINRPSSWDAYVTLWSQPFCGQGTFVGGVISNQFGEYITGTIPVSTIGLCAGTPMPYYATFEVTVISADGNESYYQFFTSDTITI